MIIRSEQMSVLARAAASQQFMDETVAYFRRVAPRHATVIGDHGLRRTILLGVQRSARYGITNPGLMQFFIELMFCFGSMFDTDPLLPWASRVLEDPTIPDEATRASKLYDEMTAYLAQVTEPGTALSMNALRRARQLRVEDFSTSDLAFEARAVEALRTMYPERCAYLGDERLRALIRRGPQVATEYGVGTDRGVVLVIGLMFVIGHGFATDPLQPWIETTLRDPGITAPENRAERLQRRMQIYLDRVIADLEQRNARVQA